MPKNLYISALLDVYGAFLNEKQRELCEYYYNDDLSLAEIAENVGITRQGVRDIIVRAENTLIETEEKTGLIKRFTEMNRALSEAEKCAEEIAALSKNKDIDALTGKLLDIIRRLKG